MQARIHAQRAHGGWRQGALEMERVGRDEGDQQQEEEGAYAGHDRCVTRWPIQSFKKSEGSFTVLVLLTVLYSSATGPVSLLGFFFVQYKFYIPYRVLVYIQYIYIILNEIWVFTLILIL